MEKLQRCSFKIDTLWLRFVEPGQNLLEIERYLKSARSLHSIRLIYIHTILSLV